MTATAGSGATRLRPPWCGILAATLGAELSATVMADPHWPGLVAAVHAATLNGHDPEQVTRAAISLVDLDQIGTAHGVSREGLATVLTWRIRDVLDADSSRITVDVPAEDEHVDAEVEELLRQWAQEHDTSPTAPVPPPRDPAEEEILGPPEEHDELAPATSRVRVVELSTLAADYYQQQFAGDVETYVVGRVGAAARQQYRFGYAPADWDALTRHLTEAAGATPDELVDAGLAKWSRRGTLYDVFRDRLVMPLHDVDGDIVGFVGRSAPGADNGPKYLNTPATVAFEKGRVLFGLHEHAALINDGAVPVRSEGFLDAIAATAAGQGRVAGLAPLGTALTDVQADLILAAAPGEQILLAPDQDPAGLTAAERDYWTLTGKGATVRAVNLPEGTDPAQLWQENPQELTRLLEADNTRSMPRLTLNTRLAALHDDLDKGWAQTRVHAARLAGDIIASAPMAEWETLVDDSTTMIGPESEDLVWRHVLAAALSWDPLVDEPGDASTERITATRVELAELAAELEASTPGTRAAQTAAIADLAMALKEQDERLQERRRLAAERRKDASSRPHHDRPRPEDGAAPTHRR